jgi:alpha-glucoside transport system substrate-binding protein
MRSRLTRFAVALTLAAGLCTGATACVGGQEVTVTIVVPWAKPAKDVSGLEYEAFYHVVLPFAQSHHFKLDIQSTTAVAQQLDADAATDNLPDLVDLPSPGAVEQYENKFDGIQLKKLPFSLSSYNKPWSSLAESAGTVYAVPVKADVKSLIWYKASVPLSPTWTALQKVSLTGTPWCLGLNNGPTASGWPGADWVADILLSQYGKAAYESWLKGAWTSGQVGKAWQAWGTLIRGGDAVFGGVLTAMETMYNKAMVGKGCELEHGALSATGLPSKFDYGYEPFPRMSSNPAPILVSGDFMGLLTDNPDAMMLLDYLSSTPTQEKWVLLGGGHAFSADRMVMPTDYPDAEQGIANLLQPGTSRTWCFSAEDIMAPDLSAAFEQAVLEYLNQPGSLNNLLYGLQKTATANAVQTKGEQQVEEKACDLP